MRTATRAWAAAAAVLATLGTVAADFVLGHPSHLTYSRMDPLIFPEKVGGHVHVVIGASNFRNVLNSPEEQLRAKCTTVKVGDDKSLYWVPTVYWINPNGTYTALQAQQRIYYNFLSDGGEIQPFPLGLRMISGIADKRIPGHVRVQGVYANFERGDNRGYIQNGTVHPEPFDTLMLNVYFPSCGLASQALDSDDHFSHMAWPINMVGDDPQWLVYGKTCPDSHPIRYPQIFMETFWEFSKEMQAQWNKTGPNVVLSNGDVTGMTMHGDFVNGWEPETLKATIAQCGEGINIGDDLDHCAPLNATLQLDAMHECRMEGTIPAENVGFTGAIDKLPGCNPLWGWDGPDEKPECKEEDPEPSYVAPEVQWNGWFNFFPLVLPGVDKSDLWNMVSGVWNQISTPEPKFVPWASIGYGNNARNVSDVTRGPMDQPVDSGTKISVVPGQKDTSTFNGRKPADKVDWRKVAGNLSPARQLNWQCRDNDPKYYAVPCGPYAAASRAALVSVHLVPVTLVAVLWALV